MQSRVFGGRGSVIKICRDSKLVNELQILNNFDGTFVKLLQT